MTGTPSEQARRTPRGWWDISPRISAETAVFPGDVPLSRRVGMDFALGHHLRLSDLTTTVHIGAHADAPSHYDPAGAPIDEVDIERYVGPCQVMGVQVPAGSRIQVSDLPGEVSASRLLLRTASYPDSRQWRGDFVSLSPQLIDFLADRGLVLVGIDTPSVDPADDTALCAHQRVAARGLSLLEGLILGNVPDGEYTLMALPLAIVGADASPVRAVLLPPDRGAVPGGLGGMGPSRPK